ncbi:MAG: AraC family ligand binding domain-containing protein, partial [Christensenellales bacterium]
MKCFNWEFNFDPYFPVHFFEYSVRGDCDPMHWHQYFEIGLCTQGDGTFIYMNKSYTVNTGDIFINNNYENHVAVTSKEQTNSYIFLILMPSFISDPINHRANKQYITTFYYNPPDFINKIPNYTATANRLKKLIEQGFQVYKNRGNMWEIEVDIVIRKILFELAAHYQQNGSKESARENINPKILLALKYIKQNYNKTLLL